MNHHDYLAFDTSCVSTSQPGDNDYHILFSGDMLLVRNKDDSIALPRRSDIRLPDSVLSNTQYLGLWHGTPCYASIANIPDTLPSGFCTHSLRSLLPVFTEEEFLVCARASQILQWDKNHRFCGQCGTPTVQRATERSKECPRCGLIAFPRISPAIIVAVVRDNTLLLAHNASANHSFYSVLAGFLEPGESFETCVKREVFEEVALRIKNIHYFGSQPWPFPDSLMVAFTAQYDSGTIAVDGVEIDHADWYLPNNLPATPRTGSISRKLIDWFLAGSHHG